MCIITPHDAFVAASPLGPWELNEVRATRLSAHAQFKLRGSKAIDEQTAPPITMFMSEGED